MQEHIVYKLKKYSSFWSTLHDISWSISSRGVDWAASAADVTDERRQPLSLPVDARVAKTCTMKNAISRSQTPQHFLMKVFPDYLTCSSSFIVSFSGNFITARRAAWNADAVWRWEFSLSVCPSVCLSVKRVNCD